jgi:hypothetical protein
MSSEKAADYELHAIVIKNNIPVEEAREIAHSIIKNKKKIFMRETKNSYRFRNIPKTKFEKKSFRTKKPNANISLIYGIPLNKKLDGKGLSDIFSPQKALNKISRETLAKYGNIRITHLNIMRKPIPHVIGRMINLITKGQADQHYDKLFHLALIATVDNKNILIEKNETININPSFKITNDTEIQKVGLKRGSTINELLDKAEKSMGKDRFYLYDGLNNNCQDFIIGVLEASGLLTEQARKFVKQDMETLVKNIPSFAQKIGKFVTNAAGVFNKFIGGNQNIPPYLVPHLEGGMIRKPKGDLEDENIIFNPADFSRPKKTNIPVMMDRPLDPNIKKPKLKEKEVKQETPQPRRRVNMELIVQPRQFDDEIELFDDGRYKNLLNLKPQYDNEEEARFYKTMSLEKERSDRKKFDGKGKGLLLKKK